MGTNSHRWIIITGLFLIYIFLTQGYSTTSISPVTSYFPLDHVTDNSSEEVATNDIAQLRIWNRSAHDFEQVTVYPSSTANRYGELPSGQLSGYSPVSWSEDRIQIEVVLDRNMPGLYAFLHSELLGTEFGYFTLALDVGSDEETLALELMQILMMVEFEGGLCPYGVCKSALNLYSNGTYITEDGSGNQAIGHVRQLSLEDLVQAIEDTDFAEIRSQAFTGTCPTAFDGQEVTYTFYTTDGVERIPSCIYQIAPSTPLFSAVTQIIAEQVSPT